MCSPHSIMYAHGVSHDTNTLEQDLVERCSLRIRIHPRKNLSIEAGEGDLKALSILECSQTCQLFDFLSTFCYLKQPGDYKNRR